MKRRGHIIQRPKKTPDKGQTMIYKTLHRKQKIEQQKPQTKVKPWSIKHYTEN
jgi:hypothetical protein